jgi:thiol-disulfide isomerase/thioredoxin
MKPSVVGLITLTAIALLALYAFSLGSQALKQGFQGDYGKTDARGTFVMYYADWCPHCVKAKPIFKRFMGDKGMVVVNGVPIGIKMVEEKQIQKGVDPDVKGFPSFLYSDAAGKTVEFDGPRTPDGFMKFLEQQVLS